MPRRSILLISSWMQRCSFQFWSFFPTAIALRVFRHSVPCGKSLPSLVLWRVPPTPNSLHFLTFVSQSAAVEKVLAEGSLNSFFNLSSRFPNCVRFWVFSHRKGRGTNWHVCLLRCFSGSWLVLQKTFFGGFSQLFYYPSPSLIHLLRQMAGDFFQFRTIFLGKWLMLQKIFFGWSPLLFLIFSPLVKGCCFRKVFGGFP